MSLTVCVDLDGVLNTYDGWKGEEHFAAVRPGAIAFVNALLDRYDVVVLTTRPREATRLWLQQQGFPSSLKVTDVKPPALVYLDDRAMTFDGSFDGLVGRIVAFKAHWERE